jgi:pimeloyl-CoA synthetase
MKKDRFAEMTREFDEAFDKTVRSYLDYCLQETPPLFLESVLQFIYDEINKVNRLSVRTYLVRKHEDIKQYIKSEMSNPYIVEQKKKMVLDWYRRGIWVDEVLSKPNIMEVILLYYLFSEFVFYECSDNR